MKEKTRNTKKELGLIANYRYHAYVNSIADGIFEAYGRPSTYKVIAWRDCVEDMLVHNGYGMKICGHNCMKFSCAYMYDVDGISHLRYFTADNTYDFPVFG